jgi:hypothetical protein
MLRNHPSVRSGLLFQNSQLTHTSVQLSLTSSKLLQKDDCAFLSVSRTKWVLFCEPEASCLCLLPTVPNNPRRVRLIEALSQAYWVLEVLMLCFAVKVYRGVIVFMGRQYFLSLIYQPKHSG